MTHMIKPPESFLDKSVRLGKQGIEVMGTAKGLWDTGKWAIGGLSAAAQYARPLMALL